MHSNLVFEFDPRGEIRRYPIGGTHASYLREIFGEWPENKPEMDDDPRRVKAFSVIRQILHFTYHERVFDRFIYDGYLDGLTHMDRLLSFYTYKNAVSKAHFLVHERLSTLNHIEAVFFAYSESEERKRRRINQNGRDITPLESYLFALREGLKYGLTLALAQRSEGMMPPSFVLDYATELDFMLNVQPKMSVRHVDRLNVQAVDVIVNGWSHAVEFIRIVSMVEVWKRADKSLYDPIKDPFANRFKRILSRKDLQSLFVKSLRANKQMFHLFRLGCGYTSCRPSSGNLVFNLGLHADWVPVCHIADLLGKLENPTGSRTDWWKQS